MIVLPRLLEMLKCIRSDDPTAREIAAHTGISDSQLRVYLRVLEQDGFITSAPSIDKQSKGRVPRVFSVAPAWRGKG